jgi:hypothetical protein
MAETLNGTFDDSSVISVSETISANGYAEGGSMHFLAVKNIEYSDGMVALIRYDNGQKPSYGGSAGSGGTTTYTAHLTDINGVFLFSGTLGYQRIFNAAGVEQDGYQWMTISNVNLVGLTGNKVIYLDYVDSKIPVTFTRYDGDGANPFPATNGMMAFRAPSSMGGGYYHKAFGNYQLTKDLAFHNIYSVTKPSGVGIQGSVIKQINATTYPSRVYIYNGLTNAIVTSESVITATDFYFDIPSAVAETLKISVQSSIPRTYNSSVLFTTSGYSFNFTVSPKTVLLGSPTIGYLSSLSSTNLQAIAAINIYKSGNTASNDFYESNSTTKQLNYVLRGGNWMGWDTATNDFTNNKGATLPISYGLNFEYPGNYTVGAFIYTSDGALADVSAGVVSVTGNDESPTAKVIVLLQSTDATTSQFIPSPSYSVKNNLLNTWTNVTGSPYDSGYSLQVAQGTPITVIINKAGYSTTTFTKSINGNDIIITPLTPTNLPIPTSNLNWTNLQVTLKFTNDGVQYYPLSSASVSVESFDPADSIAKQYGNTNSEGIVFFTVLNQSHNHAQTYSYVITSVIPNYKTVSKSIIPTGNLYTVQLWTQATQIINPTGQPTLIPITTIPTTTPVPVITPSSWGGNGITGGNGSVCAPITSSTTILESFKINLACNGVTGAQAQSLTIAGLICLVFILAGARYGKGTGAAFGGIVGFVLSLAMGFIPFWVFAALIILCGLAAAIIAIRSST